MDLSVSRKTMIRTHKHHIYKFNYKNDNEWNDGNTVEERVPADYGHMYVLSTSLYA